MATVYHLLCNNFIDGIGQFKYYIMNVTCTSKPDLWFMQIINLFIPNYFTLILATRRLIVLKQCNLQWPIHMALLSKNEVETEKRCKNVNRQIIILFDSRRKKKHSTKNYNYSTFWLLVLFQSSINYILNKWWQPLILAIKNLLLGWNCQFDRLHKYEFWVI